MAQTWTDHLLSVGEVWSIGQLDKEAIRALDRLVREGKATREREHWAGIALKTVWRRA